MPLGAEEIAPIATSALGLVQTGIGLFEKAATRRRQNKLFRQRSTYQTPDELFDVRNALESRMGGLDPAVLQYLTGETDRAFGSGLGVLQRGGGDPNDVSALFDQKINAIMDIGAKSHAVSMENFSKVLSATAAIGESRTAEWQSRENLLRDRLAAEGVNFQNANAGLQSGLNTIIAAGSAYAQSQLYKDKKVKDNSTTSFLPTTANSRLLDNNLIYTGG